MSSKKTWTKPRPDTPRPKTTIPTPLSFSDIPEVRDIGPTLKAFTLEREDGNWVMATIHYYKDGAGKYHIEDVDRTVPDIKAVAVERFKINAFQYWVKL